MDEIYYEVRDKVIWIYINRPKKKNALRYEDAVALTGYIRKAGLDKGIRVAVIKGIGGAFCAGADLTIGGIGNVTFEERVRGCYQELIKEIVQIDIPVIAAVDGPAVGFGSDLALSCCLRVATKRSFFAEVFPKVGLMTDGGGSFFLPRIVGLARAFELCYTAREIYAEEALTIGMINRLCADDEIERVVQEICDSIITKAPLAISAIKKAIYLSLSSDVIRGIEREGEYQKPLLNSEDFREGVIAFFEKRKPDFKGR